MDLWLSDVVPGPPDGAPQVVAVTGRMITLAWNPPRSLDMAIGGSRPHGGMGGEGRAWTRQAQAGHRGGGGGQERKARPMAIYRSEWEWMER